MAPPRETDFRDMAMDALKNLVNNVPDWLQKLDDLSGQIDRRQAELAAADVAEGKNAEIKSLRNKGSTESLKPRDGPPVIHTEAPANEDIVEDGAGENATETPGKSEAFRVHTPSPASIHKQQTILRAQRDRAKYTVTKKPKPPSMNSDKDFPEVYRTQSTMTVYYDDYVQTAFNDLVVNVSKILEAMRKAKLAARSAQFKRLAEEGVSKDENNDDKPPSSGVGNQPSDVYDKLNKGLKFVQRVCEHGALQFLLDSDCNNEIRKVRKKLTKILSMAQAEKERVEPGEPELAKETGEIVQVPTGQPIVICCDNVADPKEGKPTSTEEQNDLENKLEIMAPMYMVSKYNGSDEGIDVEMEPPKLQYRSTPAMHSPKP
ncbi:hypothetical protein FOPG_19967 [Fusarium oxysporum f. sp. conglutinans race 2 54008]|uniref:Uncharacterized protein n=1 Tax=Fusarium oxysporum f. sp. conglutinans race 2 54008 TaxID=1089457 RepID=X0GV31_FUSOX|nr:hypothetical protein FOPG_19967 [Fusarium oxysporum f. sp. conglutinans race 2 54008]